MKNKILVQICDKEYSIITEEPEEYVQSLASDINKMIEDTAYKNLRTSKFDATMITCLDLCDRIHKLTEDNDNMRREIVGYVDEIGRLSKKVAAFERQKAGKNPGAKIAPEEPEEVIPEPASAENDDLIETIAAEEEIITEKAAGFDDSEEFEDTGGEDSDKTNSPVYRQF